MAHYSVLLGKRVEVQYRAGDIHLPATATLVADSGKSIFLEEYIRQDGRVKAFRWEIPYASIVRVSECLDLPPVAPASSNSPAQKNVDVSGLLNFNKCPEKA